MNWDLQDLFRRHATDIARFLRQKGHDPETVKDITQDTFMRIHDKEKHKNISNIRSYLFRIADNLATDYFRAAKSRNRYVTASETFDAADESPDQERVADYRQRLALLEKAVASLPPRQKQVFLMHKFDDLSHVEIAQELGITRSAVEKLIMKALAHCREQLGEHLE
ncbi:RNA polymerase sigma factor [Paenochrobactrum pullorum]|uniref:RNA polymerase sigma factor n=1 Tax=Paenochrobactrum pullorum TaxID=1324351 RepID=UPI0035BC5373